MADRRIPRKSFKLLKKMVARDGIEPPTPAFRRAAGDTTELRSTARARPRIRNDAKEWWPGTGLNRRRRPFQGRALPLSYLASVEKCSCPPRRTRSSWRARKGRRSPRTVRCKQPHQYTKPKVQGQAAALDYTGEQSCGATSLLVSCKLQQA